MSKRLLGFTLIFFSISCVNAASRHELLQRVRLQMAALAAQDQAAVLQPLERLEKITPPQKKETFKDSLKKARDYVSTINMRRIYRKGQRLHVVKNLEHHLKHAVGPEEQRRLLAAIQHIESGGESVRYPLMYRAAYLLTKSAPEIATSLVVAALALLAAEKVSVMRNQTKRDQESTDLSNTASTGELIASSDEGPDETPTFSPSQIKKADRAGKKAVTPEKRKPAAPAEPIRSQQEALADMMEKKRRQIEEARVVREREQAGAEALISGDYSSYSDDSAWDTDYGDDEDFAPPQPQGASKTPVASGSGDESEGGVEDSFEAIRQALPPEEAEAFNAQVEAVEGSLFEHLSHQMGTRRGSVRGRDADTSGVSVPSDAEEEGWSSEDEPEKPKDTDQTKPGVKPASKFVVRTSIQRPRPRARR